MFCPRCGSNQSDELKFCKACGANLEAVRQAVDGRDSDKKFDWSKTWVADMMMSGEEAHRRQIDMARQRQELATERQRGTTPATRRYQEIKAGVITASAGFGVSVFLSIFMQGIILSGSVSASTAEILSRLWVAGVIPIFVGFALIINGYFISRKIVELSQNDPYSGLEPHTDPHSLNAADTSEFLPSSFSVTEGTTQHLGARKQN